MDTEYYIYLAHFFIGGLLITLIYHFGKQNNTILCSIIPAFPTMFLIGFFILHYFNANLEMYVQNAIYTFGLDCLCMILLLVLLLYLKHTFLCVGLFMIIYVYILYYLVDTSILK